MTTLEVGLAIWSTLSTALGGVAAAKARGASALAVAQERGAQAALEPVLDRLALVEGRLEGCEAKHAEAQRVSRMARQRARKAEARTLVAEQRVELLSGEVGRLAARLAESRSDDTGRHELEAIADRNTPPSLPPLRRTMQEE